MLSETVRGSSVFFTDFFDRDCYVICRQARFFPLAIRPVYDDCGLPAGYIRERTHVFTRLFPFSPVNSLFPFTIQVVTEEGDTLLTIKKGWSFFYSRIFLFNPANELAGSIRQRVQLCGSCFFIYDAGESEVTRMKVNLRSGRLGIYDRQGKEMARFSGKWKGWLAELLQPRGPYEVRLAETIAGRDEKMLVFAAALAVSKVVGSCP